MFVSSDRLYGEKGEDKGVPMVQVDVVWGYAFGASFAAAASQQSVAAKGATFGLSARSG